MALNARLRSNVPHEEGEASLADCVFLTGVPRGGSSKGFKCEVETHGPGVRVLGDPVCRYRGHWLIYLGSSSYLHAVLRAIHLVLLGICNAGVLGVRGKI